MALKELDNFVLTFLMLNPFPTIFKTLSTHNADTSGLIGGFLYVPDLDQDLACYNISKQYVPSNVTRQANLPSTDFTLIALAPWINIECTQGYLAAAREDPVRAFIFYQPDNSTTQPPPINSEQWALGDGGSWKATNKYPVYAVPGSVGARMMREISLYSGNLTDVPNGHEISSFPGVDPRDYVRVYTQLSVSHGTNLPNLWEFLLIVIGVLAVMLAITSGSMHFIQSSRRRSLRRRVEKRRKCLYSHTILVGSSFHLHTEVQNTAEQISSRVLPADENEISVCDESIPKTMSPTFTPALEICSIPVTPPEQQFVPFSQPTCPICLDDFESGTTLIRELPCGHIFHPECIDPFLSNNSSLCPLCKKSVLPIGDCPVDITNAMVNRERNMRRLRSRIIIQEDNHDIEAGHSRFLVGNIGSSFKRRMFSTSTVPANNVQMTVGSPIPTGPPLMTSAIPSQSEVNSILGAEVLQDGLSRQERAQQRIRELAAQQPAIEDPDLVQARHQSSWRRAFSKAFPGYS
ncbi:hypothetical protein EYC84_004817 [Monilinia fructicola]|uniref:RING-type domain-containing protein n=1 Tax=Monilinia fructicola TaxID=38448 RepID=A0A5M9K1M4_MONFR|nr:hypothetical protein EYC84_004817 [Monilinia fructicola]